MTKEKMTLRRIAFDELMAFYYRGYDLEQAEQGSETFQKLSRDEKVLIEDAVIAQIEEEKQAEFEVVMSDDIDLGGIYA